MTTTDPSIPHFVPPEHRAVTSTTRMSLSAEGLEVRAQHGGADPDLSQLSFHVHANQEREGRWHSLSADVSVWGTPAELFALARRIDAEVAALVVADGALAADLADLPWPPEYAERVDSVVIIGTMADDGTIENLAVEPPHPYPYPAWYGPVPRNHDLNPHADDGPIEVNCCSFHYPKDKQTADDSDRDAAALRVIDRGPL